MKGSKLSVLLIGTMVLSVITTACGVDNPKSTIASRGDKPIVTIIKGEKPELNPAVVKSRKNTLVIGTEKPEGLFNPLYMRSPGDFTVTNTIFDGLLDIDKDGQPISGIADKWEVSDDGLVYTFHMKKDVKFSNGEPVTAKDVVFTFTVACDKSYTGTLDVSRMKLKGYKEYKDGKATTVAGVTAKDDKTVVFTLSEKNASVMYNFTTGILSKNYYGKNYKQGDTKSIIALNQNPIGCGQYVMTSYKAGQEAALVANEKYWKGTPKIKNLIYRATTNDTKMVMLASGEIDIAGLNATGESVDLAKHAGFLNIQMFPTDYYGYIGMNCKDAKFADKNVRKALAYGLNRKEIVKTAYKDIAEVLNTPYSKANFAYDENIEKYEYNLEKANKLLNDSGWKVGADGIREKDGKKLEIHFTVDKSDYFTSVLIERAQRDYRDLGIHFISEPMESSVVRNMIDNGQCEMFFMSSILTADPNCSSMYFSKGLENKFNYSNVKVDELCNKGIATLDKGERQKIYQKLGKELNNDLPCIYMYQSRDMWVINERVKNIQCNPYKGLQYDLWKAELK